MSTKSYVSLANKYDRVIVLVDMDCFYCQVEEKLNPDLAGKPIAVVQYNAYKGGGIIAVNYPARYKGVTRHMRGDEAKEHCPEIELVKVPSVREKADLTKYRDAGKRVAAVLQTFTTLLERASVDEAYLDITERVVEKMKQMNEGNYRLEPDKLSNTFAVGYGTIGEFVQNLSSVVGRTTTDDGDFLSEEDFAVYKKSDIKLLIGAAIVNEIRAAVKEQTGYDCSAGIAHNKILAKFVCGLNKPNKQTLLPLKKIPELLATLPIGKVTGLGGKFGEQVVEKLKIKFIGDLREFDEAHLQKYFDRQGSWLYLMGRGIDLEAVKAKFMSKSIGCCKNFPGISAITGLATLEHWLLELAKEIVERLGKDEAENNRRAKQMTVSFTQAMNGEDLASTRSVTLAAVEAEVISKDAMDTIKRNTAQFIKPDSIKVLNNPIKFLGISVGKFENIQTEHKNSIKALFSNQAKRNEEKTEETVVEEVPKEVECEPETIKVVEPEKKSFFKNFLKKSSDQPVVEDVKPVLRPMTVEKINEEFECRPEETDNEIEPEVVIEDEPQPSTSNASMSYTETYAEFYRPSFVQTTFEVCPKCQQKIPDHEFQSHLDFHFALNLSQQQRDVFRQEIKSKIASPPPNKKPKTTPTTTVITPIDKFLKPRTPEPAIDQEKCPECGKPISAEKMMEHLDYHTARKLQIELNTVGGGVSASAPTSSRKIVNSKKNGDKKMGMGNLLKFFDVNTK